MCRIIHDDVLISELNVCQQIVLDEIWLYMLAIVILQKFPILVNLTRVRMVERVRPRVTPNLAVLVLPDTPVTRVVKVGILFTEVY